MKCHWVKKYDLILLQLRKYEKYELHNLDFLDYKR